MVRQAHHDKCHPRALVEGLFWKLGFGILHYGMYLTVHATIGVLIGEQVAQPIASFVLGALSHFLTDRIPHGDYVRMTDSQGNKIADTTFTMKIIACSDAALTMGSLWFLLHTPALSWSTVSAVIGSLAPDFLWGFHELTRWRALLPYRKFHSRFHPHPNNDVPFWFGTLYQFVFISLVVFLR